MSNIEQFKLDSFKNVVAGVRSGRGKSQFADVSNTSLRNMFDYLDMMYELDWLCAKIVDAYPNEATRKGWLLNGIDEEQTKIIEQFDRNFEIEGKINEALKYARLYGGAGILLNVVDGLEPDQPLNPEKITEVITLPVLDSRRLQPFRIDRNPLSKEYGQPELYKITSEGSVSLNIHRSRLLLFEGAKLPYYAKKRANYWGGSVLQRVLDPIKDAGIIQGAVAELVYEAKIDIIKMPNLTQLLMSNDNNALINLYENINLQKSITNSILLDSEMDTVSHSYQFAGLRDILIESMVTVAAASEIPEFILTGRSHGGLNASEKEIYNAWLDKISSYQKVNMLKPLTTLYQIACTVNKIDSTDVEVEFIPLKQESERERADRTLVEAQTDQIYVGMGVVLEEEVREELLKRGDYTQIDEKLNLDDVQAEEYQQEIEKLNMEIEANNTAQNGTPDEQNQPPVDEKTKTDSEEQINALKLQENDIDQQKNKIQGDLYVLKEAEQIIDLQKAELEVKIAEAVINGENIDKMNLEEANLSLEKAQNELEQEGLNKQVLDLDQQSEEIERQILELEKALLEQPQGDQ